MVFATGYKYSFPFLPPNLQEKSGYHQCLYKHVFPPRLSKPTLAMVGLIFGQGGQPPLAEMHARWATRVFKGKTPKSGLVRLNYKMLDRNKINNIVFSHSSVGLAKLPTEEMMLDKIATETGTMHQRYKKNSNDHCSLPPLSLKRGFVLS